MPWVLVLHATSAALDHKLNSRSSFFDDFNVQLLFSARCRWPNSLGNEFLVLFYFYFYFLVFLDVFWCAESENDVSFFVVSAVFL